MDANYKQNQGNKSNFNHHFSSGHSDAIADKVCVSKIQVGIVVQCQLTLNMSLKIEQYKYPDLQETITWYTIARGAAYSHYIDDNF